MLDRHRLLHAKALHQTGDPLRSEATHQLVFERDVKARRPGITLAAGATAQLVVDPARLVSLGPDDVQTARVGNAWAEFDVGSTPGHVRGDRHVRWLTSVFDD